jgi:hypothetical protein
MTLPLSPLLLVGLAVAIVAVTAAIALLADEVRAVSWPQAEGTVTRDDRGRDVQLEHLIRVLHASTMDEAHRSLGVLVQRRLATSWGVEPGDPAGARAVLGPELHDFLGRPPPANQEAYLTALAVALDRIERL